MIARRQTILISGPAEMRSWPEGFICQAGPTRWIGQYPNVQYDIPENYRCDLQDVWIIIRWVRSQIGQFKIEGKNIVGEKRTLKRRSKSKITMLPEDNWSAIFVAKDGTRFYDGVIALLTGAEYVGDYPNGTYNIFNEPKILLDHLNAVLNYVNKQFPDGWHVEGKEVVAGAVDPPVLPERKLSKWQQDYRARILEEERRINEAVPQALQRGIRDFVSGTIKVRKIKRREESPLSKGLRTIKRIRRR